MAMITAEVPQRTIQTASEAAGSQGELLMLRIIPKALLKDMSQIEDKRTRNMEKEKALNLLDQCVEQARKSWRGENPPRFSSILREGIPLDIISSLSDSFKPDLIIISETDSHRLGSFASGDLVAAVKKKTGLPVRVVNHRQGERR